MLFHLPIRAERQGREARREHPKMYSLELYAPQSRPLGLIGFGLVTMKKMMTMVVDDVNYDDNDDDDVDGDNEEDDDSGGR